MKLLYLILILVVVVHCEDYQFIKFKRLRCIFSSKLIAENSTCFVKPIDRNTTGMNVKILFKEPINFVYVNMLATVLKYLKNCFFFSVEISNFIQIWNNLS